MPELDDQATKVITVLEADVDPGRAGALLQAYAREGGALPPEIVETFLVRDIAAGTRYRIMTVWVSLEALEAMRASVEKPRGVQIFEEAGASPTLQVFEVVHRLGH